MKVTITVCHFGCFVGLDAQFGYFGKDSYARLDSNLIRANVVNSVSTMIELTILRL